MTLSIYLEYLYHYRCHLCGGEISQSYWSISDKHPHPGGTVACPYCGASHTIPETITDGRQASLRYSPALGRWTEDDKEFARKVVDLMGAMIEGEE